jgi:metal-responsive CopG/Arc/MetJ family transcriptional regulator
MIENYLKTSISLSEARVRQLDLICAARGTTRASVIREAIHAYLEHDLRRSVDFKRLAMVSEFTQVAVDILIREQAPERRDDILATVQERMGQYHA